METYTINTRWLNKETTLEYDTFSRDHAVLFSGNQLLNNSSAPSYLGNSEASNPEELLAAALSSCHMLTFLAICSKSHFVVASYEDDAVALLEKNGETNLLSITEISLHPIVKFIGENVPDEAKLKSLHEKAHKNCFIANSIKAKVNIIF
jgi:organic hydroperoxide reductase OsmC/OhrA